MRLKLDTKPFSFKLKEVVETSQGIIKEKIEADLSWNTETA